MAERLDIADQREVAACLSPDEKLGQRLPSEQLLLASFERAKAGDQPCFGREGGKQRLGESVDGLDAEAPARGVEHPSEQGSSLLEGLGIVRLPQRRQLFPERRSVQSHPIGQAGVDSVCHLGSAGLGKGQAEDRGRIHARKKQAQHASREHVRLARPRGSGKRRMVSGARRSKLIAREWRK